MRDLGLLSQESRLTRPPFPPRQRPIVSICWGHRDSRLLMASGPALYVVRVEHRVSSLQLLCQQAIASALREDKDVNKLTLPPRLCSYLSTAFIPTIKVKPPTASSLTLPACPQGTTGRRVGSGRWARVCKQSTSHVAPIVCRCPPLCSPPLVSVSKADWSWVMELILSWHR